MHKRWTSCCRDMPNTPNSHVTYSILSGNEDKKFSIEGSGKAVVVLRKKLDFEAGDRVFNLTVLAQVSHWLYIISDRYLLFCLIRRHLKYYSSITVRHTGNWWVLFVRLWVVLGRMKFSIWPQRCSECCLLPLFSCWPWGLQLHQMKRKYHQTFHLKFYLFIKLLCRSPINILKYFQVRCSTFKTLCWIYKYLRRFTLF